MNWLSIKNEFLNSWDSYASGVVEDTDINVFFQKGALSVFKKLYNNLDLDSSYTSELAPLMKQQTISSSQAYVDFASEVGDVNNPFERLVSLEVTYVVNNKTIGPKVAQPLNAAEQISPYSQGTYRYPRYQYRSTLDDGSYGGNSMRAYIYPSRAITAKTVTYFRDFIPFNFGDAGFEAAECPYGNKTIQMLVDEALKLAANAYREEGFFQTQTAVQTVDNINN